MEQNKTAIVIGATGLVGKQLVNILINDDVFSNIKLFVRRSSGFSHPKIEEHIIEFDKLSFYKEKIKGDALFSCMGTTIKQVKTKAAQYLVDYTYQYETARIAAENGVSTYLLVSSGGANSKSNIFYTRIKGELEDSVKKMNFKHIRIFQPSVLMGERDENRFGEHMAAKIINPLAKILPFLRKYRGIKDKEVAQAMVGVYKKDSSDKISVYKYDEIFDLSANK